NEGSGRVEKIAHSRGIRLDKRGPDEGAHFVHHRKLDRANLKNFGSKRRHFQHLLKGDLRKATRLGLDARIGRVDPVHVGIDVAAISLHSSGNSNRARIGTASTQCRDAVVRGNPLETGNDRDLTFLEAFYQEGTVNVLDPGRAMR